MRRLRGLMKAKRRISERSSESEASEEDGVQQQRNNNRTSSSSSSLDSSVKETDDSRCSTKDSQEVEPVSAPSRRSTKKRTTKGKVSAVASKSEEGDSVSETTASLKDDTEDRNDSDNLISEQENGGMAKSGTNKRRRKDDQKKHKASTSNRAEDSDDEQEYEVEKIVGHRTIKGRRQFLVRWKGYGEDSDTWEQEKELKCHKLIEEYLDELENEEVIPEKPVKSQKNKSQKQEKEKDVKKLRHNTKRKSHQEEEQKNNTDEDNKNDGDNQKEFEVERIIEVRFKRNKTREFLIHWKGFSHADNTWEPEENLQNCHELITKFMQKVENAKNSGVRELRSNRLRTKRYTLAMHNAERRLSRRNMDKERATYHECDE